MSLINEALKQARKAPPRNLPGALPPLQPGGDESSPLLGWLLAAVVVILIVAAIFFIGWAWAQHTVRLIETTPSPIEATPAPVVATLPVVAPPVEPPPATNAPAIPKLQGIFYSPTAPSAILDGKTIRLGDQYRQYRVKAISKYTVTLVGPDKKEVQIGMEN
jgi:hypothetical protein